MERRVRREREHAALTHAADDLSRAPKWRRAPDFSSTTTPPSDAGVPGRAETLDGEARRLTPIQRCIDSGERVRATGTQHGRIAMRAAAFNERDVNASSDGSNEP
jgi:hypothetical protein